MARPLRIEYPGSIYHLTVRMLGNWKRESNRLFEDERDRCRFLERLGERVESFEIRRSAAMAQSADREQPQRKGMDERPDFERVIEGGGGVQG